MQSQEGPGSSKKRDKPSIKKLWVRGILITAIFNFSNPRNSYRTSNRLANCKFRDASLTTITVEFSVLIGRSQVNRKTIRLVLMSEMVIANWRGKKFAMRHRLPLSLPFLVMKEDENIAKWKWPWPKSPLLRETLVLQMLAAMKSHRKKTLEFPKNFAISTKNNSQTSLLRSAPCIHKDFRQ